MSFAKLPRDLALAFLLGPKNLRRRVSRPVYPSLLLPAIAPMQYRMFERSIQATAAHMKPKALAPILALWPL